MAIGRTNAGGGNPLNFKVVASATEPANPKENAIWVKTSIPINYLFIDGVTWAPGWAAEKGNVYLGYEAGAGLPGADNALLNIVKLRGNMRELLAKLTACHQNQDGTASGWERMDAYIYKSGNWVQFSASPRLPSEYQEVSYIQSTGTQYLKPDFAPDKVNAFQHKFKFNATTTDEGFLIARNDTAARYNFQFIEGSLYFSIGSTTRQISVPISANTNYAYDVTITPTVASVEVDGINYGSAKVAVAASDMALYMFARNFDSSGTADTFAKAKLYYWEIYKNGTLAYNFIPCYRKSDSTAGMYDLVNNKFYSNAGTGIFIVGGDA